MSSTSLETPKTVFTSKTITSYSIVNIGIVLGESATIQVALFDSTGSFIQNVTFQMTGSAYTGWGASDIPYVDAFIVSQINNLTTL